MPLNNYKAQDSTHSKELSGPNVNLEKVVKSLCEEMILKEFQAGTCTLICIFKNHFDC
jgi:hypothetical protein